MLLSPEDARLTSNVEELGVHVVVLEIARLVPLGTPVILGD